MVLGTLIVPYEDELLEYPSITIDRGWLQDQQSFLLDVCYPRYLCMKWEGYVDLECMTNIRAIFFQQFPLVQNADVLIECAKFYLALRTVVYQRHNRKKRGDSSTTPSVTTAIQSAMSAVEVVPTSDDDKKVVSSSQLPLQVAVVEHNEEDVSSSQQPFDVMA
ncbi:hypothetical protein EDD18DRAFT_1115661 [Armillaria luteobubalina]|uniref:Uncharacterized protein n=1 Tax=Armillaria luteobubalina TaxID=153913 RepID=A0AA39UB84_9AGAR|nr:hypothetical protein EDD18DRAFT_1115661 [Armillaria luteobubalina]